MCFSVASAGSCERREQFTSCRTYVWAFEYVEMLEPQRYMFAEVMKHTLHLCFAAIVDLCMCVNLVTSERPPLCTTNLPIEEVCGRPFATEEKAAMDLCASAEATLTALNWRLIAMKLIENKQDSYMATGLAGRDQELFRAQVIINFALNANFYVNNEKSPPTFINSNVVQCLGKVFSYANGKNGLIKCDVVDCGLFDVNSVSLESDKERILLI